MFPAPRQRWVEAMSHSDEAISSITHPTLMVHGRDDQVIPLATSLRLNQLDRRQSGAHLRAAVDTGPRSNTLPSSPSSQPTSSTPTRPRERLPGAHRWGRHRWHVGGYRAAPNRRGRRHHRHRPELAGVRSGDHDHWPDAASLARRSACTRRSLRSVTSARVSGCATYRATSSETSRHRSRPKPASQAAAASCDPSCTGSCRPAFDRPSARVSLGVSVDRISTRMVAASMSISAMDEAGDTTWSSAPTASRLVPAPDFPNAPSPQYTGQSVWRITPPRPADVECRHFFLGGPAKVGFTPVSRDEMYLFVLERTPADLPPVRANWSARWSAFCSTTAARWRRSVIRSQRRLRLSFARSKRSSCQHPGMSVASC